MDKDEKNAEFRLALRDALALSLFLAMSWGGLGMAQAWASGLILR